MNGQEILLLALPVLGFAGVAIAGERQRKRANAHNAALEARLSEGSRENPTRLST